jgi:hypothetical protein
MNKLTAVAPEVDILHDIMEAETLERVEGSNMLALCVLVGDSIASKDPS